MNPNHLRICCETRKLPRRYRFRILLKLNYVTFNTYSACHLLLPQKLDVIVPSSKPQKIKALRSHSEFYQNFQGATCVILCCCCFAYMCVVQKCLKNARKQQPLHTELKMEKQLHNYVVILVEYVIKLINKFKQLRLS